MNTVTTAAPKSKSQRKRELLALQELGQQLVGLPQKSLIRVPMSSRLREAVMEAQGYSRGALSRQLQYIGKLMIEEDEAAIRKSLETISRPRQQEVETLHEVEQWRDRLIDGDDTLLDELCTRFATADRQHLRQLGRNALRQRQQGQAPRAARMLYHYLAELHTGQDAEDPGHG